MLESAVVLAAPPHGARGRAGLEEEASLLLDLARVRDDDSPRDPAGFARRVAKALASPRG